MLKRITRSIQQGLSERLLRIRPMDECFPQAEKVPFVAIKEERIETPELLDMPLLPQTEHLRGPSYTTPVPYTAEIRNAGFCVDDGTIVSAPRTIMAECSNTRSQAFEFRWQAHVFKKRKRIEGACTTIFSASVSSGFFYHILIDSLPRLYLLRERFGAEKEIKLLVPGSYKLVEKYFIERLLPENVTPVFLEAGCIYTVERFLFASFLTPIFVAYLPKPYMEHFLPRVLPGRPGTKDKRIYISRAGAPKRRVLNEERLIAALRERGFESYRFEELTMAEQIELMHDAEAIVTPHGAALTNLIFSGNAVVVELFGMRHVKPNYYFLCKCVGNRYYHLCHDADQINVDFEVDIEKVERLLDTAGIIQVGEAQ